MIMHAAIKRGNIVYVGKRHPDCRDIMIKCGIPRPVLTNADGTRTIQGFVNDKGEFLTREEAAKEALACGQITKLKYHSRELFSEDLY